MIPESPVAWIDGEGRPSRELRPKLDAEAYVVSACSELESSLDELVVRSRRRDLAELRFLIVGLGIERWGPRAGEIAEIFGRRPDYVSWWAKRARELRLANLEWALRYESLDECLRRRYSGSNG